MDTAPCAHTGRQRLEGELDVSAVAGAANPSTSNGGIVFAGGEQAVTLVGSNGRIEVRDIGSDDIEVSTSNGDVSVRRSR